MRENRDVCINMVFGHEKGFVNRPKTDAGGPTNMGITQKTLSAHRGYQVTVADVKNLTRKEAYKIYANKYWHSIRGDDLPSGVDYCVFDSNVTTSTKRVIMMLQQSLVNLGEKNTNGTPLAIDGIMGDETMNAVWRTNAEHLISMYCDERIKYMKSLGGPKGFASNGRGWTIRVTGKDPKGQWKDEPGVVGNALKMYRASRSTDPNAGPKPLPIEVPPVIAEEITAKANDSLISLPTILKTKEALTGIATTITAVLAAVSANTILSYAAAIVIVIGAVVAGTYFVKRIRSGTL